jgi:hypothetical protein
VRVSRAPVGKVFPGLAKGVATDISKPLSRLAALAP